MPDFYLLVLTTDCDVPFDMDRLDVLRSREEASEIIDRYVFHADGDIQTDLLARQITVACESGGGSTEWIWDEPLEDGETAFDCRIAVNVTHTVYAIEDPSAAYIREHTESEDVARHYESVMPFYVYRRWEGRCGKDLGFVKVSITDIFPKVPFVGNVKRFVGRDFGIEYMCQRVFLGANKAILHVD